MDRSKPIEIVKAVHPLGWACEKCFHVVRDPTPGSRAMKCCRWPPTPQLVAERSGAMTVMSICPPVQEGEWCGEYQPDAGHRA